MNLKLTAYWTLLCASLMARCAQSRQRYLLYSHSPAADIGDRKDMYMIAASLVRRMNSDERCGAEWTVVLPPWNPLPLRAAGMSPESEREISWSQFFNLNRFREFVPVVEFSEYVKEIGEPVVERVWYLQVMDKTGAKVECEPTYTRDGRHAVGLFGHQDTRGLELECMKVERKLQLDAVVGDVCKSQARSILLDRMEYVMGTVERLTGPEYWASKRSMSFAEELRRFAKDFIVRQLKPNEGNVALEPTVTGCDGTTTPTGGSYIAVYMSAKQLLRSTESVEQSLRLIADQLRAKKMQFGARKIFVSFDDGRSEWLELLKRHIPEMIRVERTASRLRKYGVTGMRIIDKLVCSYSRYFASVSRACSFTYFVHDARQLLCFPANRTFNRLCPSGTNSNKCAQPAPHRTLDRRRIERSIGAWKWH